jgi:signal transduction histidine kinase
MKNVFRGNWYIAAVWFLLLGAYVLISLGVPAGTARITAANILLCVMPLLVNGALLINAVTPDWRKQAFWMLLSLGCTFWLAGQAVWTYIEVYHHRNTPYLSNGYFSNVDIIFFLHTVLMIAALAVQPHKPSDDRKLLYSYVDFGLILCWWLYLYVCVVIPWQYVVTDGKRYVEAFSVVVLLQNIVFVGGAIRLSMSATRYWRRIYGHLAAVEAVYVIRLIIIQVVVGRGSYTRGSLYDLPLLISFLWLGATGIVAYRHRDEDSNASVQPATQSAQDANASTDTIWASRAARLALFSLPLIGFWCLRISEAPLAVREFRLLVSLGAVLPLGVLVFLRHELADREHLQVLRASQESFDNLKRLQTQFVQSEKLASIGQLVGGAAHEINNPLTAILGYSELLADDPSAAESARSIAVKIRDQARRTKTLVGNLLSFARQVPSEHRSPIDINAIVNTSVQFRRFDLRGKNIRFVVQAEAGIPEVRADMNQLLQVFSNIINNAVDAMDEAGGGTLTVKTLFEKGNVVILFSDTGPGMSDPNLVFDPFYTTKPVGKGTGLGLSICYGLIQDQGGQISCYNRSEGGATFRIDLPAIPVAFPFSPRSVGATTHREPAKMA